MPRDRIVAAPKPSAKLSATMASRNWGSFLHIGQNTAPYSRWFRWQIEMIALLWPTARSVNREARQTFATFRAACSGRENSQRGANKTVLVSPE
jgi:hypothetical protein